MTEFRYEALDADGRRITGALAAPDYDALIAKLSAQGCLPISASEITGAARDKHSAAKALTAKTLPDFTRRLAHMAGAGVTLEAALAALAEGKGAGAEEAAALRETLRGGASFADALAAAGAPFDAFYIGLVRVGEAAGDVGGAIAWLAEDLETRAEIRAGLLSALAYPALLSVAAVGLIGLLLGYIVPRFETLFDSAGAGPPPVTSVVFFLSDIAAALWWAPLVLFIAAYGMWRVLQNSPDGAAALGRFVLSLPRAGDIIRRTETARLMRGLGGLTARSVPLDAALPLAADMLKNASLQQAAHRALNAVAEGQSLSAAFKAETGFDSVAADVIAAGETSGALGPALLRAATLMEQEVKRELKTLLALLEPVIILTLGLTIGGVVLALFSAVLSVNDLAF